MTKPTADARAISTPALRSIALSVVIAGLVLLWGSALTGDEKRVRIVDVIYVLLTSLPWMLLWLASATGFGFIARQFLRTRPRPPIELDGVLVPVTGIAILLLLDASLGSLGLFQIGGTTAGAWVITSFGIIPFLWMVLRRAKQPIHIDAVAVRKISILMPGIALLALACCSTPGWLWDSEFGGYDALSYHLQLPKEWFAASQIIPFEHNIYSFLPGYMEAAYYHLMTLRGDPIEALYACQMLHAVMAVLTALATARLVRSFMPTAHQTEPSVVDRLSAAIVIGTPWIIVVGSLAYNEMPTALMLAISLILIFESRGTPMTRAILLGLFMAVAIGCKPTSAGLVALPVAIVAFVHGPKRIQTLLMLGSATLIGLLPWLARNYFFCEQPTFPFLTGLFGTAHYSVDQNAIWNSAHQGPPSIGLRLHEAFQQLFRYGIGPNPDPTGHEPWQAQWSILPWLAIAGSVLAMTNKQLRKPAIYLLIIILVQITFWIFFTHIKSRFMLPMVVPAAAAVSLGILRFLPSNKPISRPILIAFGIATIVWIAQPLVLFYEQSGGAPASRIGDYDLLTGLALRNEDVPNLASVLPPVMVNRALDDHARVLLVGESAPLYLDIDKIVYCTVWDRGPMSRVIADHPDEPAQWMSALKSDGFTHILLAPVMLTVWQASGWSDPALDPTSLRSAFDRYAVLLQTFPNGDRLYQLP